MVVAKLQTFIQECARVLKVTKKPTKQEFLTVAKVAGIGILIIGLLGFLIFTIKQLVV